MRCPSLAELPPPPPGKTGWPWTEESTRLPDTQPTGEPWPKISIVMPSFQQGEYIEKSLRSILLQGCPEVECIIIDGGSTDDSVTILKKYSPWLTFWVSERDQGSSDAAAKGFAMVTGELLGIMCADDLYQRDAFATLLQLRRENPNCVLWGGACPELDLKGNFKDPGVPWINDFNSVGDWCEAAWFSSVACLFDAKAYQATGGIDERFLNANDADLWLRLSKLGKFALTSQSVAQVRSDPTSLSRRDDLANIAGLITSNYIRGDREIAKRILTRSIRTHLTRSPAAEILSLRPAYDFVGIIPARELLVGVIRRLLNPVRQRLTRSKSK